MKRSLIAAVALLAAACQQGGGDKPDSNAASVGANTV